MRVASFFVLLSAVVSNLFPVRAESLYDALSTNNYTGFLDLLGAESGDTIQFILTFSPNVTLFVPSNEAIMLASTYPEALGWYTRAENAMSLYGIIGSHIMQASTGTMTTADIETLSDINMITNRTFPVMSNMSLDLLMVGIGTVSNTDRDIVADNGILHEVDRVISLPKMIEALQGDPSVSLLFQLLGGSNFVNDLAAGNLTLLVPNVTTFTSLGMLFPELFQVLFEPSWELHLLAILNSHLLPGFVFTPDLTNGETLTTLSGLPVTFTVADNDVSVSPAGVTGASPVPLISQNQVAMDGVAHRLAGVIVPPFLGMDVVMVAGQYGYTEFLKFVELANLTTALKTSFGITVQVPTDEAFGKLDSATVAHLMSAAGKDDLVNILTYHVIKMDTNDLVPQMLVPIGTTEYPTLQTLKASVTKTNDADPLIFSTVPITGVDIIASNGLIREISAVSIPSNYVGPVNITDPPNINVTNGNVTSAGGRMIGAKACAVVAAVVAAATALF